MNALVNSDYVKCLEACQECLIDCKVCLAKMAGEKSTNECPYCCLECVEVIQATIGLMALDSQFAKAQCKLCAEVCERCAEICGAHDHDHCQKCAESCRQCAAACRAMAA